MQHEETREKHDSCRSKPPWTGALVQYGACLRRIGLPLRRLSLWWPWHDIPLKEWPRWWLRQSRLRSPYSLRVPPQAPPHVPPPVPPHTRSRSGTSTARAHAPPRGDETPLVPPQRERRPPPRQSTTRRRGLRRACRRSPRTAARSSPRPLWGTRTPNRCRPAAASAQTGGRDRGAPRPSRAPHP